MPDAHYINDPKHWLDRAAEMRALAHDIKDMKARESMVRIAEEYERLAHRAEKRSNGQVQSEKN
jgi:hypothetical protein